MFRAVPQWPRSGWLPMSARTRGAPGIGCRAYDSSNRKSSPGPLRPKTKGHPKGCPFVSSCADSSDAVVSERHRCRSNPGPYIVERRFCAVRGFAPGKTSAQGAFISPEHVKSPEGGGGLGPPEPKKKDTLFSVSFFLEVTPGFEPGNESFADSCLTTWLCHHQL